MFCLMSSQQLEAGILSLVKTLSKYNTISINTAVGNDEGAKQWKSHNDPQPCRWLVDAATDISE